MNSDPMQRVALYAAQRCSGESCKQGRRACGTPDACLISPEEAQDWVADLWDGARVLILFLAILLVCRLLLVAARALT